MITKLTKITAIASLAAFTILGATVANAQETTVKSKDGDVTVTTDDRGTYVRDTAGNVGHVDGGSTRADHDRVVDMFKDR